MSDTKDNNSSLPAPTVDVKIRTMNSDMQSMGLGGGFPQMNIQQIPTVDLNPAPQVQQVVNPTSSSGSKKIIYIILSVVGVAILFVLGFFLPKLLLGNQPVTPPPTTQGGKATTTVTTPQTPPVKPTTFTHSTFFKVGTGGTTTITLSNSSAENVSATISQQTALISASFSETAFTKDSNPMTWKEFINLYGWNFLPETFFTENFKDDFTSFIYKDAMGTFPGYILQLKPDASIVLLRSQLLKIESDPTAVAKVFLSSPSNPEVSFKDAQISNQPVRTLKFGSGETFYYGWFNNEYLIFGTSEEGTKQAFSKL